MVIDNYFVSCNIAYDHFWQVLQVRKILLRFQDYNSSALLAVWSAYTFLFMNVQSKVDVI
jgi:hypothetical protein